MYVFGIANGQFPLASFDQIPEVMRLLGLIEGSAESRQVQTAQPTPRANLPWDPVDAVAKLGIANNMVQGNQGGWATWP
jgi:hypothetical protein